MKTENVDGSMKTHPDTVHRGPVRKETDAIVLGRTRIIMSADMKGEIASLGIGIHSQKSQGIQEYQKKMGFP